MKKKMTFIRKQLWYVFLVVSFTGMAQNKMATQSNEETLVDPSKKIEAQNYTYQGNKAVAKDNFVQAEADYRKAMGVNPNNPTAAFNLGSSFYDKEAFNEALSPLKKAASVADNESEKHAIFHNMGNVFMKNKAYEKAVEAYKEALRNNPKDDQTRYNLALAKEMLKKEKQEQEQNKDQKDKDESEKDQDKEQEKKDPQDQEGDQKKDQEGNPDKGDGDQKDEKGDPKDPGEDEKEKQKQGEGDQKKETPEKPNEKAENEPPKRKSQLSPQQIQNLLEAMQNAEKKSQEKLDAKKVKGTPVKTKKDW